MFGACFSVEVEVGGTAAVVSGVVGNARYVQLLCVCRSTLSQTPVPGVTVFKVGAKVVNTVTIGEFVVGSVGTIQSFQGVSLSDARNHITKHDLRYNMTEAEVLQDWQDVHGKILWPRVRLTVNGGLWSTVLVKPATMNVEDKHGEWVWRTSMVIGFAAEYRCHCCLHML